MILIFEADCPQADMRPNVHAPSLKYYDTVGFPWKEDDSPCWKSQGKALSMRGTSELARVDAVANSTKGRSDFVHEYPRCIIS